MGSQLSLGCLGTVGCQENCRMRGEKRDFSIIATKQLYLSLGLSWDQLQARTGPQLQGCASRNVPPLSLGSGFVSWEEMQEV